MLPYDLEKWEVVKVYHPDLRQPHDKFCICICPKNGWFLYVNSDPPFARKAKAVALELSAHEASFIHKTSFVDTTRLEEINTDDRVVKALKEPERRLGAISPSLKRRIIEAVVDHEALAAGMQAVLLAGETLP